eukprot:CAMPEP_0170579964 /NCGR_PEP_ID=MMETSP0224-20130122/6262_1 /TAXON_ID=285029 /ORGANISM="Togula jolla, Strain CCCM 725" /LENGTH=67 /DNA_ID=CAMNT_0010903019 /DNA_START=204 /DNA_END=407 /DNA_ORIENTATION=-
MLNSASFTGYEVRVTTKAVAEPVATTPRAISEKPSKMPSPQMRAVDGSSDDASFEALSAMDSNSKSQ